MSRLFCLFASLAVPIVPLFASPGAAMLSLKQKTESGVCRQLRPQANDCAVAFETVTHNALSESDGLWAFSYVLAHQGAANAREAGELRSAIERTGAVPLEIEKNRIAAIAYFRGGTGTLSAVRGEDFHRLALNPASGIVARFDPRFILAGHVIRYQAPANWQKDGFATGSTGTLTLGVSGPREAEFVVSSETLDDEPHKTVHIVGCRTPSAVCEAGALRLGGKQAQTIALELKAARNLKTDQPAFKVVLRLRGQSAPVMHLAIPFKPRPNYFLFGVTGFLFGGLIAVMVMIGRRKPQAVK